MFPGLTGEIRSKIFQEVANRLVGEKIDLMKRSLDVMRFVLSTGSAARYPSGYMDCVNRLADKRAAFKLLHFLRHLNGAAFTRAPADHLRHLNPTIIRALSQHLLQTTGSPYQLHTRRYEVWDVSDVFDSLLAKTGRRVNGDAAPGAGFIHTRSIAGYVRDLGVVRMMEMATAVGNKCLKLVCEVNPDSVVAEVQEIIDEALNVGISLSLATSYYNAPLFQFAINYRPQPGDCPVRRVRIRYTGRVRMESLSRSLPFPHPSQLVDRGKPYRRKFEHTHPTSGRRFGVGVRWRLNVAGDRRYYIRSLSFSLP